MSYSLELGYWQPKTISHGEPPQNAFVVAKVQPFESGHNVPADSLVRELTGEDVRIVDNDGLTEASIHVTSNYSQRILELTGVYVSYINGAKASETAPILMKLISGLGDEVSDDYWEASDGNIKRVASTVLDWTFQHPDAEFVWIP